MFYESVYGGGNYSTNEVFTGKYWIDGKKIYRKVIDFGALPNNSTKTVNTNISNGYEIVNYSAIAKNASNVYLPLPYSSTGASTNNIQMNITISDITIITGIDRSSQSAKVTLEYTKTTD